MKITLASALQQRNKLVADLADLQQKMIRNFSIMEGENFEYNFEILYRKFEELQDKLVELKTKIQTANVPILSVIFLLSELKNELKMLKSLPFKRDQRDLRYVGGEQISSVLKATNSLTREEVDKKIEDLNLKIQILQNRLNEHNHTTMIEFD